MLTLTQTQENQIDAFQRKMIRINVLNIKWPKKMSNENIYKLSKIKTWTSKVKKQRLNWFGRLVRLDENVPAKKALKYAMAKYRSKKGRPKAKWLTMMEKQLKADLDLTWEEAELAARNRSDWRNMVKQKYP